MKTFLVPVDGSPNADRAVSHAIEMVQAMKAAKLLLLNVQEQLERWYEHGLNSEASLRHLREQGEAQSARARKLLDQGGCAYDFLVMFGAPAEVIARVAKEHNCTGIIMGTRGLGEIESLLLGSTSFKVAHLTEVPVTLVR